MFHRPKPPGLVLSRASPLLQSHIYRSSYAILYRANDFLNSFQDADEVGVLTRSDYRADQWFTGFRAEAQ